MEVKVATFDCYGTLIDWEGGAASFLYELARRHEREPPPGRELRERWEELQFERLQGEYRSYREILADSLAEWAGERGYRWNDARRRGARPLDGVLAAVPGHGCRRCGRPARRACGCGSSRTRTGRSSSTRYATSRSSSTA